MSHVTQLRLIQATVLLDATHKAITKRRKVEQWCGYPDDYGNDKQILEAINIFLDDPEIQEILNIEYEKNKNKRVRR